MSDGIDQDIAQTISSCAPVFAALRKKDANALVNPEPHSLDEVRDALVTLRNLIGETGSAVVESTAGKADVLIRAEMLDEALRRYERLRDVTLGDLLRALPFRCSELPRLVLVGHPPFSWDSVQAEDSEQH